MSDSIKIVTIGGGSSYTPELIEGYIKRSKELPVREIVLVDIEEGKEKLEIVGEMAKRMVQAAGLDWKVTLSVNRKEVLKDADFVTTQFRVGLLDARVKDESIPLSHGIIGQETNGAGGILKAFRTIPVILDLIEDMKEQCPEAWLINFTNPAGMMTETAIKHAGWKKTIGLCNLPIGSYKRAQESLELPAEKLFIKFAGINHFHWHKVWDHRGNDRTMELITKMYKSESEQKSEAQNIGNSAFHYDQLKDLGMLPAGYHRYYYVQNDMLNKMLEDFDNGSIRAQVVKKTERDLFELYKDPELDYKPNELAQRGGAYYSEIACEIIDSIQNDKRTEMVVSTQNNGTIVDLPYDSIVEVSGVVTAHGFEPYNWGAFPPEARGDLQQMKSMEETVIRAAIEGDYGAALHAFTMNMLIPGGAIAKTLLDEMLYAHKDYLPQFQSKIKEIEENQPETIEYIDNLMKDISQ